MTLLCLRLGSSGVVRNSGTGIRTSGPFQCSPAVGKEAEELQLFRPMRSGRDKASMLPIICSG